MLTGVVNIAVFAAFHCVIPGGLPSNAEFKPVCGLEELDIWCYGRQQWQETARGMAKTARSGKVGGKNGNVSERYWGVQAHAAVDVSE